MAHQGPPPLLRGNLGCISQINPFLLAESAELAEKAELAYLTAPRLGITIAKFHCLGDKLPERDDVERASPTGMIR